MIDKNKKEGLFDIDTDVRDGLFLGNPSVSQLNPAPILGFCIHDLSDYARKNNLYPITQEVIYRARKDGVL
ncbi:MAG: hypothetical protein RRY24_06855 [Clostridiales bacterium]